MRKICKGAPLDGFSSYLRQYHPQQWKDIPAELSKQCRLHILKREQCGLSGYTEKPLDDDNRTLHIDHFRKQELFNTEIFNWNNFIVDEKNTPYGADAKDGRNGVKSVGEYATIINPIEENPHHYFRYMVDGKIVPVEESDAAKKKKALHTIEIFNLNHPALCKLRKDKIGQVVSLKKGKISATEIPGILKDNGFLSVVEYFCQPQIFEEL